MDDLHHHCSPPYSQPANSPLCCCLICSSEAAGQRNCLGVFFLIITYIFYTEDGCSWLDQVAAQNRVCSCILLWPLHSEHWASHLPRSYSSLKELLSFKWKKERGAKRREEASQAEMVLRVPGEPRTSCFSRSGDIPDCVGHRLLQSRIQHLLGWYKGDYRGSTTTLFHPSGCIVHPRN